MMRILTAGESHGRGLVAIMEGLPAGLKVKTLISSTTSSSAGRWDSAAASACR